MLPALPTKADDQCMGTNSWPDSMDDSAAREEWGWKPGYDLKSMTEDMIKVLEKKLK